METRSTLVAAMAAAGAFFRGRWTASAQPDAGIGAHQLLGSRYDIMLALARRLDAAAENARKRSEEVVLGGSPVPVRLLSEIRSFARSVRELLGTMADREVTSIHLPSQLAALAHSAWLMKGRLRWANTLASTCDEWDAVTEVLELMLRLVAGHDVDLPSAYVQSALSGASVREIRQLASDVEATSARAHGKATRAAVGHRQRGEQLLGEVRHFAGQGRDLRVQANIATPHAEALGPLVDHLLAEARQADRRMRDARVFTELREDSARTITNLERMASLVRP